MSVILAVLDAVDAGTLNISSHFACTITHTLSIHSSCDVDVVFITGYFFSLKTSVRVLIKLHRRVTGKTVEKPITSDKSTS